MNRFQSGKVEIAFHDAGEGSPILLVHGFGSNVVVNWGSTGWIRTLTGAGYRVVAMDVRGHGQSGKLYEAHDYRPAIMAEDAANLLDHLSIETADVMGYSMGARIAAYLALAEAGRLRSLILGGMASGLFEAAGGEAEIAAALTAERLDEVSGAGRAYRKFADQTNSDRKALAACILAQREIIAPDRLATIAARTLIAVGTRDTVAGSADRLAGLMPNASAFAIPGRDHMLATGDRTFKARVLDFLKQSD